MMAHSICLSCMQRVVRPIVPNLAVYNFVKAGFSTSTPMDKQAPTQKGKKTLRLAKNKRVKTTKPPAPGERRAFKKKILLNNPNAVEVPELEDFTADKLKLRGASTSSSKRDESSLDDTMSTVLRGYEGHVLGLNDDTAQALLALDIFRPSQSWRMFRRPATIVRSQTVTMAEMICSAEKEKAAKSMIFTGPRGSGKSVMLLQAAAMAHVKGWVVIHVPESKDLINAHTSYRAHTGVDGKQTYIQPHYVAQLLRKIVRANQTVLSEILLCKEHKLPVPTHSNMSLARLAELGRDTELAWPIWQAFWEELTASSSPDKEGQKRPPILFMVDDVNNIMRSTSYLDADMQSIHAHDLALIKHFNDLLLGKFPTPNGSVTLGATTRSNGLGAATMDFVLNQSRNAESLQLDPFLSIDQRVVDVLKTVPVQRIVGLSKSEARAIIEHYARCGLLMNAVTDTFVGEKWSLAGGGVVGILEKATISPLL